MKTKTMCVLAVLALSLFLVACSADYSAPNQQGQPQGQQQNQYVGGGCGVAPDADYKEPFKVEDSAL
ncbi:hypothetical protein HYT92_03400 [Candidatus Pacearchaeota archaeon]|nr:hypothetical protein [Candidatus Pacearchaeota archaeon]